MRARIAALLLAFLMQAASVAVSAAAAEVRPANIEIAVHLLFDRSAPSLAQKDGEEVRQFVVSVESRPNPGVSGQSQLIVTTRHKDIADSVPFGQESRRSRWDIVGKNRLRGTLKWAKNATFVLGVTIGSDYRTCTASFAVALLKGETDYVTTRPNGEEQKFSNFRVVNTVCRIEPMP